MYKRSLSENMYYAQQCYCKVVQLLILSIDNRQIDWPNPVIWASERGVV